MAEARDRAVESIETKLVKDVWRKEKKKHRVAKRRRGSKAAKRTTAVG